MSNPWDEEGLPELTAPRALDPLSLSPRHVGTEAQTVFYAGQLLADLHSQGLRYTDLHRGNFGMMPVGGGLVIIDPGGFVRSVLEPQNMAGDFTVPLLDFSPQEFQAFVCGYVERSHILIDAAHPGFTDKLLASIGLNNDLITHDPRVSHGIIPEDTEEWTKAVRLANACLVISSDTEPAYQEAYLARFLNIENAHAWPEGGPLAELLTSIALGKSGSDLIEKLAAGRKLGALPPDSGQSGHTSGIRPTSRGATQILAALDEDSRETAVMRAAFVEVCFLLAGEACNSDSTDGNATAIALLTLGFAISADHSTDVARYERLHYQMWHRLQMMPVSNVLSLARAEASELHTALSVALFFLRAGLFEMEYFGASLSAARKNEESLCGYAIVCAVRLFRRALIVLSIHALPAAAHEETLGLFRGVAHSVISGYLHATRLAGTASKKRRDASAAFQLWGTKVEALVECADWLQRSMARLTSSDLEESDLLAIFQEGRKHFVFEDFEVETPFDTIKVTRQDVYRDMFAVKDDENSDERE